MADKPEIDQHCLVCCPQCGEDRWEVHSYSHHIMIECAELGCTYTADIFPSRWGEMEWRATDA